MITYAEKKVAHLKRMGLVASSKSGRGMHGGACPDWLADQQRKDEEKAGKARDPKA